jgi:hypothetical protein
MPLQQTISEQDKDDLLIVDDQTEGLIPAKTNKGIDHLIEQWAFMIVAEVTRKAAWRKNSPARLVWMKLRSL